MEIIYRLGPNFLIILAGEPATMEKGGISFVTSEPAPTIENSPTVTFGMIRTPVPIQQSFSKTTLPQTGGITFISLDQFASHSSIIVILGVAATLSLIISWQLFPKIELMTNSSGPI